MADIYLDLRRRQAYTWVASVYIDGSVKGSGRGGQHQQQQSTLGREGDFAVHASVYGKVQAKPNVYD